MGPNAGLYNDFKASMGSRVPIETIGDGIIGVDWSILLYKILISLGSLLLFHQSPTIHIPQLRSGIEDFHRNMLDNQLCYEMVLDGLPHPGKKASIDRSTKSVVAFEELTLLLKNPKSDMTRVLKLMKETKILSPTRPLCNGWKLISPHSNCLLMSLHFWIFRIWCCLDYPPERLGARHICYATREPTR